MTIPIDGTCRMRIEKMLSDLGMDIKKASPV